MTQRYSSDLSDKEWELINAHFKSQYNKQGRPPSKDLREQFNALFYVLKNGCYWKDLPKDFPHWKTCYNLFSRLKVSGKLEEIMRSVHKKARECYSRHEIPSLGIIDSQTVKSCSQKKSGKGLRWE